MRDRFWFLWQATPFEGVRANTLPFLSRDEWCRTTVVVPLLGFGALIVALGRKKHDTTTSCTCHL